MVLALLLMFDLLLLLECHAINIYLLGERREASQVKAVLAIEANRESK